MGKITHGEKSIHDILDILLSLSKFGEDGRYGIIGIYMDRENNIYNSIINEFRKKGKYITSTMVRKAIDILERSSIIENGTPRFLIITPIGRALINGYMKVREERE